jgi:PAS domain S-box-containing protein
MSKPIQVLLVDDDEADFFLTRDLLEELGEGEFHVDWQASYDGGLEQLCAGRHDVCLLDYRLGAKTGLDLLREAKARNCLIPVIILTGQSEKEIDFSAMELGAADFLEKSELTAAQLERAIRYAILKHRQSELLESEVDRRTRDLERVNQSLQSEIRQRQQSDQALRESEARFRHLADAMPQIVWISDAEGNIEYINQLWSLYSGMRQEDTRHFNEILALVHDEDRPAVEEIWRQAQREPAPFQIEFRLKHILHENSRWLLSRSVPVFNELGQLISWYGTSTDIHEHKLHEAQQREANRRKDEFLASMAHELRNPLPPIRNALEIMRLAENNPQAVARGRAMIERQLNQLIRLIDDLLDLSRITRGKIPLRLARVELAAILDTAVETSRPLIDGAGHRLTVIVPKERVYFDGDATRITQVVVNLLNNAAKYTPAKGEIVLSASVVADEIVIKVLDNGIGIAPEQLGQIFEIFAQANRADPNAQGGLGIGLALVRGIVQLHGGSVHAHSAGPGKGSEFTVRLPVTQAERPFLEGETQ